jgi:hypothetical protein
MSVRLAILSCEMVMTPPEAVKGPRDPAGLGSSSVSPPEGTGLGMGTSKLSAPVDMVAGVAPETSIKAVAVPEIEVLPSAAAALTKAAGICTVVW